MKKRSNKKKANPKAKNDLDFVQKQALQGKAIYEEAFVETGIVLESKTPRTYIVRKERRV